MITGRLRLLKDMQHLARTELKTCRCQNGPLPSFIKIASKLSDKITIPFEGV